MATAAVQHATVPDGFKALDQDNFQPVLAKAVSTSGSAPRDVHTTLNYFKAPEDGSPPHPTYADKPETYDRPFESHPVTVRDVRGRESEYTLDRNGFQVHRQEATEKDFLDDDQIKASYYPEVEQLLKDVTGASRVFIFDHTIRRQPADARAQNARESGPPLRGPVQRVHIDQSYDASLSRVPHHLPDEAETLLRGRVQIINVWRPIRVVQKDPLAVAQADSVSEDELVPTALIYPTRKGETYQVKHSDKHKWFYKSGLSPEEVLLIKCFDSKTDGRARRVPHTAFVDPDAGPDAPNRESIEVRTLVFHPDDRDEISEVDVIIAGGGAAGCVVAGRLAEADPGLSILVIERGQNNQTPNIAVPGLFFTCLSPDSTVNIVHTAKKSDAVAGRALTVPTGGILGGGSSTNFMMYSRGQESDFDSWKMPGWSGKEILPYMPQLETYHGLGPKEMHGYDGPIHVSAGVFSSVRAQDDFIAAAAKVGLPEVHDLHQWGVSNAVSRANRYVSPDGVRQDAASAYVHPKLKDGKYPNLHVLLESQVNRVLFDGNKRVIGVEFRSTPQFQAKTDQKHASLQAVKARKQVIVSAGALGTPPILERSGVGEIERLRRVGISAVADVPGVGHGYQDHQLTSWTYKSALGEDETFDAVFKGDIPQLIKDGDGRMSWNGQDIGARLRPSDDEVAALGPDFQKAWDAHFRDFPDKSVALLALVVSGINPTILPPGPHVTITTFTVYPFARGRLHVTGPGIDDPLDFETGFLADEGDVDLKKLMWAYKKQREIVRRMSSYRGEAAVTHPPFGTQSRAACLETDIPLPGNVGDIHYTAEDDAVLAQFLRENVGTTWHSLGTCKMASREEMGVVDSRLNVYGVDGLKVVDLSIVPVNIGANLNNTALAVGEKAADIIIEDLKIGH